MVATDGSNPEGSSEPPGGRGSIRRIEPSSTVTVGPGRSEPRDVPRVGATVPRPLWTRPSRRESWLRSGPRTPTARFGLGCVLVAVLAIAWLWVGRRDAATERALVAATTVATRPTPQVETVVRVPRWVPDAIAATCGAHRSQTSGVVTVDCTPGRGVVTLQYRGFSSIAAVRAAYATTSAIAGGAGPAGCAGGAHEERSWSSPASPTVPSGRYLCSVVEGRARLVWTSERHHVLAIASRDDGDLRSLFEWWTTVPGPDGR